VDYAARLTRVALACSQRLTPRPLAGDWPRAELARRDTPPYSGGVTTGCSGRRCTPPPNRSVRQKGHRISHGETDERAMGTDRDYDPVPFRPSFRQRVDDSVECKEKARKRQVTPSAGLITTLRASLSHSEASHQEQ
jgi:hypothetical protein